MKHIIYGLGILLITMSITIGTATLVTIKSSTVQKALLNMGVLVK